MHEIFLLARDLASPAKTSVFEYCDNVVTCLKRAFSSWAPLSPTDQPAQWIELNTLIV